MSTESAIVLGGRRIGMRRPRARSREQGELGLPSLEAAAKEDPLDRHTLEAIALPHLPPLQPLVLRVLGSARLQHPGAVDVSGRSIDALSIGGPRSELVVAVLPFEEERPIVNRVNYERPEAARTFNTIAEYGFQMDEDRGSASITQGLYYNFGSDAVNFAVLTQEGLSEALEDLATRLPQVEAALANPD